MRRTAAVLLLLSAGGLLTACGGSGRAAATGGQVSATTSADITAAADSSSTSPNGPADASSSPTKAQALAFARAVNLRRADVPGFKVVSEHEHETAAEKRLEHAMLRCVGVGALGSGHGLAEVSSPSFERETNAMDESVQSEVSVAWTSQQATKELAVIRSNHARTCVSHYSDLLLKSQKYHGATFSPVSIAQGTPPAAGATGSFGWRITTSITYHKVTIPLSMDILGFVYGPAEVSLFTSSVPQPFPAATEEQLFSLLLSRAKTYGL